MAAAAAVATAAVAAAAATVVRPDSVVAVFLVNEAVFLLSPINDRNLDLYISKFEKIATSRR